MPNPTTIQSPATLSDIMGAYDVAHWETVVAQLKPASGVLIRGSVLSAVAADGGKLTLTAGGSEATAYGICSTIQRRTGVANSAGTVTASVARAGSFRGAALISEAGTERGHAGNATSATSESS